MFPKDNSGLITKDRLEEIHASETTSLEVAARDDERLFQGRNSKGREMEQIELIGSRK